MVDASGDGPADWLAAVPLVLLLCGYLSAARVAGRRGRRWPARRTAAWCAGLAVAGSGLLGPVAAAADRDFTAHVAGHLLLAMLAPVLLVTGRPVTLLLVALPVPAARRVSRVLGSRAVRGVTHPATAVALNIGGLWVLYRSGLYHAMRDHDAAHLAVHAHLALTGYLSTAALVGADPAPHRPGFAVRATALVAGLAAHGTLAKHLYGHPPPGVPVDQASAGALLMYYGGDVIELVLIILLCRQWYAATAERRMPTATAVSDQRVRTTYISPSSNHTFG